MARCLKIRSSEDSLSPFNRKREEEEEEEEEEGGGGGPGQTGVRV